METISQTFFEMLQDRNYKIDTKEILSNITKINHNLVLYIIEDSKVGINNIKSIQTTMEEHNVTHVIVIFSGTITAFAKTEIQNLIESNYEIEMFHSQELMYNITKHSLVPHHRLISKAEKLGLIQTYNIVEKQLPCILKTDPISKYFNAKPMNVFEIIRTSDNTFKSISYRVVV